MMSLHNYTSVAEQAGTEDCAAIRLVGKLTKPDVLLTRRKAGHDRGDLVDATDHGARLVLVNQFVSALLGGKVQCIVRYRKVFSSGASIATETADVRVTSQRIYTSLR
jgi:hypothetical protein